MHCSVERGCDKTRQEGEHADTHCRELHPADGPVIHERPESLAGQHSLEVSTDRLVACPQ